MKKNAATPSAPTVKPLAGRAQKNTATANPPLAASLAAAPLEMKPIPAAAVAVVKTRKAPSKPRTKPPEVQETPKSKESKDKAKKPKLVRDSFTMPEAEYAILGQVKKDCIKAGIEVKKSELLRVGISLLKDLDTAKVQELIGKLTPLKTGRPKKAKS
jgi:hypothetical protein